MDPHTPVIVGVGQSAERIDDPDYRAMSPVELAAAGRCQAALVFGSDATSTLRHFANAETKPDFTETVDGDLEDRRHGIEKLISRYTVIHGLTSAPIQYGLLENARRAATGLGPAEYRRTMGELFAPFTKIAASNPFAAAPTERTVDELITVTDANRMIAEPYPRLLVARDQVNRGAATLLMSIEAARRLGVPEENWVYLHGRADLEEQPLVQRLDLGHAPSAVLAVREALTMAGIGVDDVATFDLYQLLSGAGVQHLRRHGHRARRSARADPDRRGYRSSAARATTTRCTQSPRP